MMYIRRMLPSDVEQAAALEAEAFTAPWSAKAFEEMLYCEYACYLVAGQEDRVLGICGLRNILGEGEITNVAVRQEYRNRGIGRAMLEELIKEGINMGVRAFTLEVRESNAPALELYRRLGFQAEGIRRNFYDKPREDAVIMWKR